MSEWLIYPLHSSKAHHGKYESGKGNEKYIHKHKKFIVIKNSISDGSRNRSFISPPQYPNNPQKTTHSKAAIRKVTLIITLIRIVVACACRSFTTWCEG